MAKEAPQGQTGKSGGSPRNSATQLKEHGDWEGTADTNTLRTTQRAAPCMS